MSDSARYLEEEARLFDVDIQRALVWDTFADMFLDTWFDDDVIERMGETIADSPFSFEELAHILYFEVTPICYLNLFCVAGEWAGFSSNWLLPKCKALQVKHPFHSSGKNAAPVFLPLLKHLWFSSDAFSLLYRVKRIRAGRGA